MCAVADSKVKPVMPCWSHLVPPVLTRLALAPPQFRRQGLTQWRITLRGHEVSQILGCLCRLAQVEANAANLSGIHCALHKENDGLRDVRTSACFLHIMPSFRLDEDLLILVVAFIHPP